MSGNAAFLNGLKKTSETREKQFQSKIWGTIFVVGSVIATYFATDFMTRVTILGSAAVAITALYFTAKPGNSHNVRSVGSEAPVSSISRTPAPLVTVTKESTDTGTASTAKSRNGILSPIKASRDLGKHQDRQSADWNENFDVQSPQRIAHAAMTEVQLQQNSAIAAGPSGTGLLPTSTLYPNANTNYAGKSNVANLGYQFAGNTCAPSFRSPVAASATARNSGAAGSAPYGRTYQVEQSAPTWHAYHSSPTAEAVPLRAASPVAASFRTTAAFDEDDPLDDIVNRASAGSDRSAVNQIRSPFSDKNLSVNIPVNNTSTSAFSSIYTPSRGGTRSFTTPSSVRGRSNAGLTEDRLEHVLTKYLESQEQIVRELSQELLRLLAQRAFSGTTSVPFLQSQEDLVKLRSLLELQTDRQVLGNRSHLGLTELLRYCRSIGASEELLRQYEAAVAVLQSPNHTSYSNPGTPHAPSHNSTSTHPIASSSMGLYPNGNGYGASSGAYGGRNYNSIPEPVSSSSSSSAFNSSRRSRY